MPTERQGFGPAFDAPVRGRARPQLTRDTVIEAAIAVLDSEGERALTFRRLAADLGVGAASLYWHVPNREALLELALDEAAGAIWADLAEHPEDLDPAAWQLGLERAAMLLYDALLHRPWAAEQQLVSRNRGLNQLRIWDRISRIVLGTGLDEQRSFEASAAVLTCVLGAAAQEAANGRDPSSRVDYLTEMSSFLSSLDSAELPAVRRLAAVFSNHDQREEFRAGLRFLIAGIEVSVSAGDGAAI